MKSKRGGRSILYFVLLVLWTTSLAAAPAQLQILLDGDNNGSTGCRVITNLGNVDGIEAIYTTTYDNGPDGKPVVTGVTKQTCAQPGTVNFNAPVTIDAGGWPVGTDALGNVFVETRIPAAELPTALHTHMHWYFIGVQGTNLELVLQNENNAPILFPEPPLAHPRIVGPMGAREIILDGKFDDWIGIHPLVSGLAVTGGGKFRFLGGVAAYATAGNVYFNFSIQSNSNAPQANDDGYTVLRGKSLYVGPTGVLANDFDPHGKPLTAVQISGPEHGALVLNPDGSFTYANDGSPAPIDGFRYKANNGTADSNTAKVTIGVVDCNVITVNPPATSSGPVGSPFNQTFTQSGAIGAPVFTLASGTLPNGITLGTGGTLSGTPTVSGTFPITVRVTDANNCTGVSAVFNLVITCQSITVTAPATTTGVAAAAFSQTFTQSGGIGATTFSTVSALPTGLTLSSGGVLSGTPTQTGTFPIVVTATDSHSCSGSASYTLTITCQTITVTNPGTTTGTAAAAFSQTFTQTGAIGGATFTTASTLPAGLTLSAGGVLSGTPTQTGSFPIVVKVTDSNGCIGTGGTYALVINCQTITVTNPVTASGTVSSPFSQTFTASGTIGAVTFTTASTLPGGLSLSAGGVLAGTPTQTGSFPIVVKATDANGCFGTGATYTLVIGCQTITVTNPGVTSGTVSSPFSQSFSQSGAVGGATFTTASTLPGGLTLSAAGLLSGTPTQNGTFPIVVTVTDGNGCTGTSATYTLVISCQTITVTNPATTTATVGTPFSQSFSQTGAVGGATFTTASTLPTGLTLSAAGLLSGTPMQFGSFPIVVTVTDGNGCTGTGATYTLVVTCQTITVTNPATTSGVAAAAFSQTFTQIGAIGGATFTTASTLPTGLSLSAAGVLSGTPTQTGTFPIVVTVTDGNGCSGTGSTYNLTITCQTINVTNPVTTTGTVNTPFSQTFTQSGAIGTATFTLASGVLPSSVDPIRSKTVLRFRIKNDAAGLTLSSSGVLSGTPTQAGTFPITILVTDSNGCTGTSTTYNLVIGCQIIGVTNPATTTGTANAAFSQTFTAGNTVGSVTFSTASTLPTGLSLSAGGVLSGTPTQTGTFPIVVTATDGNGCSGSGSTYNLVINCQTITVTKPVNTAGTVNAAFSEQFTQAGAIGTATFSTASALPSGLTLSPGGLLAGTPLQQGTFPITVIVTDSNGCTGASAIYNLSIGCQLITVGNPGTSSFPAGTPLSVNFTQSGAIGTATFTTASTLPTGLTLAANGTLSGTPSQGGSFPIAVTVTDSNGCSGTNPPYTIIITCPTITVTNPGISSGTAGTAFGQTFTQSGGIGTITWSETGALPSGITLNSASGLLSGTTSQVGTFPITVTATDANGCQGTGATYNLTFNCQTVTVTNPGVSTGTVDAAFSQTFTVTGILGTVTWSETGALPAGVTLNSATGVLSGTPTVPGSFPITVKATDTNLCFGTSSYTLTINCQTITVTKPLVTSGTVGAPFSQTFTQSGAHGTATFTTASTLPGGLTLSTAGVLSGTPTQTGSFPIVVTVTDSNGCTGASTTYTLTINCQTITVTNPATTSGTVGVLFSQTFTQSAAQGTATFTTASTLPTGFSLSTAGVLSGTTNQHGTFPIVVTVTDSNGCTGTGSTYTLVINCQTITVTNPVNTTDTVASPFSEQFNQSGAIGGATFTTASTLPTGLTLSSSGLLSGTPTQSGSFPIVVTVTDGNACSGSGSTYTLVIGCNTLTVTNPGVSTGTAGTLFSQQFTQTGGNGTITWSETGALPGGITLNTATGFLTGTTTVTGSFPITVTATDGNGCSGTGSTYTLIINCQTITVTNPGVTSVQAGNAFDQAFTATGILGTATWSETGALPTGITLNTVTGHLAGTTTQLGSFPITVKATDSNGCFGTGATYTLTVTCPVITVSRSGGGSFPAGVIGTAYAGGNSVIASGGGGTYTFAVTSGTFPPGLTLASGGGISGTPTATGTFAFTVTATDTGSLCTGAQSFSIAVNPKTTGDSYSTLVDNTHAVVTGGSTASPGTPFVSLSGTIISNDLPAGGVTVSAGTFATTAGGSVTIAADGTFIYTPKANPGAAVTTTDSFNYTISSDTGGTGTPTSAIGTVTLNMTGRVWYVKNNGGGTDGRSHSPFTTLAAAAAASTAGDVIFVYNGDGTTTGHTAGITLKANQQLIGEGVALVVNAHTLVAAGTKPQITNATAASDAVTLNDGNTVKGLTITGATRDGISSVSAHAGFTGDTLTVQNNTNVGVDLISMTGAVTITNSTITTAGNQALTINNGTAAVTVDNTNTIGGGTGTAVSVLNRPGAAGAIAIDATITGARIQLLSNTSGTISFTGSQTLSSGTLDAVTMTTNSGATITFSGTLNITATTGNGFIASGGGTLNVTGTANITTGAAPNGLSLNGMTIGGSGVTFNSVNTTGATTGINLVNFTAAGTVTVNGGTISNGTTGVSLQGTNTSLSLAGVTITGPTTGITNTTNFGTLTIGSSVNVSGVTALSLTTGNLNGTFANLSSTGGTNGVLLTSIGGTGWTATAGSLVAATGAAFKVDGGNANMTYDGSITATGFLVDIGATTGRSGGTITFSTGTIGGAGALAGTGIRIQNSTGTSTFTFSGTQTLGTSGSRMGSTAVTLAGNNTNTTFTFSGTLSIFTGAVTAFTATGPTGGTITFSGTDSIDSTASALVLNGVNLGAGTLNNVTSTGGVNGIALTTVTGGTLTITAGSLSGNTGAAFLANAGTGSVSYGGSITQNSAGQRAVDIQNKTGGTITLSGAIGSSGGSGVFLNSNTGATIAISGNMTLSTGGVAAFTATGGGTVNVSGASNSITTSSGTGINWNGVTGTSETFNTVTATSSGAAVSITSSGATNFTIGTVSSQTGTAVSITTATGDFVFTKISSNGAAKGISVNALTGAGSFTVNGTGGLCDATHISGTDCTGGTIQGGTTRGAEFINAVGVTLNNMYFKGNATTNSGATCFDHINNGTNTTCNASLFLSSTTGPTLNKLYLDGTGTGDMGLNGNAVSGLTIGTMEVANYTANLKDAIVFQNLTGTVGITGLNVHNNTLAHNFFITNNTGTANITLTSPVIQNSPLGGVGQGNADGINAQAYNAGTTLNITSNNGTFNNIIGDTTNWAPNSGAHMTAVLSGGTSTLTGGIYMASTGNNTQMNYTISGLTSVTTNSTGSNAITAGRLNGTNITETGTISNNVIVTGSSACSTCSGIVINSYATSGLATVSVTGNNVSGNNYNGMNVVGASGANSLNITVQGNTFSTTQTSANDGYAIDIQSGPAGGDSDCLFANIGDMSAAHTVPANKNTIIGSNWVTANKISLASFNSSQFKLSGLTTFTDAGASAWTAASNTNGGTDAFHLGVNQFGGGAVCP